MVLNFLFFYFGINKYYYYYKFRAQISMQGESFFVFGNRIFFRVHNLFYLTDSVYR